MKKFIIVILIISFSLLAFAEEGDLNKGSHEGEKQANLNSGSAMWGLIGFGSGCLLTGVGCLASSLIAYLIDPSIPPSVMDESPEFLMGFKSTYKSEIKKKRALAAFIGGTIGTIVWYVAYVMLVASSASTN